MLKRSHRITATRDFARVYKRGRQMSTPLLRLSWLPANQNILRFGFVVPNKASKTLAERNRTKRRLRAQTSALSKNIAHNFEIIVQAKSGLAKLNSKEVALELEKILKKAHLWKDFSSQS